VVVVTYEASFKILSIHTMICGEDSLQPILQSPFKWEVAIKINKNK